MPNQTIVDIMVYASDKRIQRYVDKECVSILPFQIKLKDSKPTAGNLHLKLVYSQSGLQLTYVDDDNMVHKVSINLSALEEKEKKENEKEME